jgi:hypothetical protein
MSHRKTDLGIPESSKSAKVVLVRGFVTSSGVVKYAPGSFGAYRQSGTYAGRILRGEIVSNLPIQWFMDFDVITTRNSAARLGFDVPPTLLLLADDTSRLFEARS